jgi:hypothetical protein
VKAEKTGRFELSRHLEKASNYSWVRMADGRGNEPVYNERSGRACGKIHLNVAALL